MPGVVSGRITRRNAPSRVAPSTIAASSRSRGIERKYPIRSQVQNGTVNVGYATRSAQRLFLKRADLVNSLWALLVAYPTFTVPFCTWLLMGFFRSIPRDLEEAAMVDRKSV